VSLLYHYWADVTRVIDGDTFEALWDLGCHVRVLQTCRIDGIDAPEVYGVSKSAGIAAARWLVNRILNRRVFIWSTKYEKYGRALVWVWDQEPAEKKFETTVNHEMIGLGLAKAYSGGKREP